ncbi:MAG: hypothetical protein ACI9NC_005832 [Verrucomicrobiales bacterium]
MYQLHCVLVSKDVQSRLANGFGAGGARRPSVGDAIGEALSYQCYRARELADFSMLPDGAVRYTDDSEMAIGIVEVLRACQ